MSRCTTVTIGNRVYRVEMSSTGTIVNGVRTDVSNVRSDGRCGLTFETGSRTYFAIFDDGERESYVLFRGHEYPVQIANERDRLIAQNAGSAHERDHHAEIRASMPGMVARINTEIGSNVHKGQPILILEAMKMENEVRAPADGIIKSIHITAGQAVEKGDLLIVLN